MKKLKGIYTAKDSHWVGDGFWVQTVFAYTKLGKELSPFLLLDYAQPKEFAPSQLQLGVGEHPHRGFETVTIVYQGELEHRDSAGNSGKIGKGDVQWMTAASGIVHEELHSKSFTQTGGVLEMVQLWVNLPKASKMSPPRYQDISNNKIPTAILSANGSQARIIAGEYTHHKGPSKTFTPIQLWDMQIKKNDAIEIPIENGHTAAIFILRGALINSNQTAKNGDLLLFDTVDKDIKIEAKEDTSALLLSGQPIEEPIFGHGPFVMNSEIEIKQAILDFQDGKMGRLK